MSKDIPPSRAADQFVVRFPDGMRDRIAEAAKANNRSMNAEIVARLQQTFGPTTLTATLETARPITHADLARILELTERQHAETLKALQEALEPASEQTKKQKATDLPAHEVLHAPKKVSHY